MKHNPAHTTHAVALTKHSNHRRPVAEASARAQSRTPVGARKDRWTMTTVGPEGGEFVRYVRAQDLPDAIRELWIAYPDDGFIRGRRSASELDPSSHGFDAVGTVAAAPEPPAEPPSEKPNPNPTAKPRTLPRRTAAVMKPFAGRSKPMPKKPSKLLDVQPYPVAWSRDALGG